MSVRDFLSNISVILAVMALASLLEIVVPMFGDRAWTRGRRSVNLGLTAIVFLLNWLLTSAVALAAVAFAARPSGLMTRLALPQAAQIVLGVLVVDFSTSYLSHRLMHVSPTLWRFHQIHHSDDFVDATTTFRTHPVESAWRFLFAIVPVWALGIPASAVVIQRLLQATNGVLQHANIRLWRPVDRVLSLVLVTPDVHKIHHSCDVAETNSNYGNVLSLYDRLLGTFRSTEHVASVTYGLKDVDPRQVGSFPGLLSLPFRAQAPYTKVSVGSGPAR
ncbi:MAG TPA: sterol desaturase family protein [Vicinamibacterales bacterium]|nr:sterol desaturase family protein [Vicinamibacterales bacterium]